MRLICSLPGLLILLQAELSVLAQQTQDYQYWWLGLASPFGGRNYNLEQIQRGEHIANSSRSSRGGGGLALRRNRNRNKRQSQDPTLSDDSSDEIKLNEIETECPRLSKCVPSFFCERFRGVTQSDQIPCLLTSGQFPGQFGICCQDEYPRKCPEVLVPPPPSQCLPRPLGQPEDHECEEPGVRDRCTGQETLCCFNGCLNVCLEDPPYSIQRSFFIREKAFIVNSEGEAIPGQFDDGTEEDSNDDNDYDDEDDDTDYTDFINPRRTPRSKFFRNDNFSSDEADTHSVRLAHLLQRLLNRLRDRIS